VNKTPPEHTLCDSLVINRYTHLHSEDAEPAGDDDYQCCPTGRLLRESVTKTKPCNYDRQKTSGTETDEHAWSVCSAHAAHAN
jgi:hypothetical protein